MSHTPMSPSDLQRIYLLYMSYIQNSHLLHYEQDEALLCKNQDKKRSTD